MFNLGHLEDTYRQKRDQADLKRSKEQSEERAIQGALEKRVVDKIVRDIIPTIIARAAKTTLGKHDFFTIDGVERVGWEMYNHIEESNSIYRIHLLSDGHVVSTQGGLHIIPILSVHYHIFLEIALEVDVPSETIIDWMYSGPVDYTIQPVDTSASLLSYIPLHPTIIFTNKMIERDIKKFGKKKFSYKKPTFWSRLLD